MSLDDKIKATENDIRKLTSRLNKAKSRLEKLKEARRDYYLKTFGLNFGQRGIISEQMEKESIARLQPGGFSPFKAGLAYEVIGYDDTTMNNICIGLVDKRSDYVQYQTNFEAHLIQRSIERDNHERS